jgi:putative variant cofactor biosynthesis B12-binding/radical SAM domain protein 1
MRLMLIQLPTSHLGAGECVYPLGLARLARLAPAGWEVCPLDLNLAADPWPALQARLLDVRPQVTALSFRNLDPLAGQSQSYLPSLKTAARLVRRLCPETRLLAGGPAFTLFPERLMAEVPEIDAGLVGEGEAVFASLVAAPQTAAQLPGVVLRVNGRIAANPPAHALSLDGLPLPDTAAFPPEDYRRRNRYVTAVGLEGKRGCDLACAYCLYPAIGGRRLRLRAPGAVVDEMEFWQQAHGVRSFHFTDGVLNRPAAHFAALCREILRRRLAVSWTGFFREEAVTPGQLALAREAGLNTVYFSGDALTAAGLALLGKRMTPGHLLGAARATVEAGLLTVDHFLVNLPGETPALAAGARELLERLLEIHHPAGNLGAVILSPVRLYPGAPLTRALQRQGLLPAGADLLYPTYHDPPEGAHRRHELEALCHTAGVFSRLGLGGAAPPGATP